MQGQVFWGSGKSQMKGGKLLKITRFKIAGAAGEALLVTEGLPDMPGNLQ
jgi:hypothetical protein